MTCSNCGDGALTREYTLRFDFDGQSTKELDLTLCTDCLRELCSDSSVEAVDGSDHLPVE
ncbi:hypothetical protein [Halosimplex amylolyticum]|uniref:hypothetical protein n=1 Tax=Halosimplex amylolyticum TaxID=3396616 RepID=UPI003F553408